MSALEIVATWGDTVVERTVVPEGGSFALAGEPIVHAGVALRMRGEVGLVAYTVTRVDAPARTLPYPFEADRRWAAYLAISLAVHLVVWGVATERAPVRARERTPLVHPDHGPRFVHLHASIGQEAHAPTVDNEVGTMWIGAKPPTGPRDAIAPLATTRRHAGSGSDEALPQVSIRSLLDSEALTRAGAFDALTGSVPIANGFGDHGSRTVVGDPTGFGSLGGSRGGFGATCDDADCRDGVRAAPYATSAHADARWAPMRGRRPPPPPKITLCGSGNAWRGCGASGDLDKAIIRRYLRRHLAKIAYCFERELLRDPTAAGTVTTQFFITPTGHVQDVVASGGHPDVGTCIAGVIAAIEFPAAPRGGSTQVTYPFTLHAAGS